MAYFTESSCAWQIFRTQQFATQQLTTQTEYEQLCMAQWEQSSKASTIHLSAHKCELAI